MCNEKSIQILKTSSTPCLVMQIRTSSTIPSSIRSPFRNGPFGIRPACHQNYWWHPRDPLAHCPYLPFSERMCTNKTGTGPNLKGNFNYLTFDIWFHFSQARIIHLRACVCITVRLAKMQIRNACVHTFCTWEYALLFHCRFIAGINSARFFRSAKK